MSDFVPVGYRFAPTDEELVVHYLANKVAGRPLPSRAVAEADVYGTEPWNLLGDHRREAFFFAHRKRKSATGSRVDRRAGRGSWNLYSKEEHITSVVGGVEVAVGSKRSLSFNDGQRKNSGWTLHEYELASSSSSGFQTQVLCHVKKSSTGSQPQQSVVSSRSQLMKRRGDQSPAAVTESQQQLCYAALASPLIPSVDVSCLPSSKKARLDEHQPEAEDVVIFVDPASVGVHQQQPWQPLGNSPSCSLPALIPYGVNPYQDPAFSLPAPSMGSNTFDHDSIPFPGVDVVAAAAAETPNPALPSTTADTSTGGFGAAVDDSAIISSADLEAFWQQISSDDIADGCITVEELEAFLRDDTQ